MSTPGAGGTVANNLAALGVKTVNVMVVVGEDGYAHELKQALSARGIAPDLLIGTESFSTFTYTKLLNATTGQEDLARIDFVNARDLPLDAEQSLLHAFRTHASRFDVIIVADQAEKLPCVNAVHRFAIFQVCFDDIFDLGVSRLAHLPNRLPQVQYFLVGGALCLFYLLLLSISEHAAFVIAYTIASAATIAARPWRSKPP